jgi:hypothetical protein
MHESDGTRTRDLQRDSRCGCIDRGTLRLGSALDGDDRVVNSQRRVAHVDLALALERSGPDQGCVRIGDEPACLKLLRSDELTELKRQNDSPYGVGSRRRSNSHTPAGGHAVPGACAEPREPGHCSR